jgi:hypothetical protein
VPGRRRRLSLAIGELRPSLPLLFPGRSVHRRSRSDLVARSRRSDRIRQTCSSSSIGSARPRSRPRRSDPPNLVLVPSLSSARGLVRASSRRCPAGFVQFVFRAWLPLSCLRMLLIQYADPVRCLHVRDRLYNLPIRPRTSCLRLQIQLLARGSCSACQTFYSCPCVAAVWPVRPFLGRSSSAAAVRPPVSDQFCLFPLCVDQLNKKKAFRHGFLLR